MGIDAEGPHRIVIAGRVDDAEIEFEPVPGARNDAGCDRRRAALEFDVLAAYEREANE